MSRRARLILITALAVLALLVGIVALAVHVLLKPARFTAMMEKAAASAGFVLRIDRPAETQWWPHLGVRVRGLRLSVAGADSPLLVAGEAYVVVPWHSLLGGTVAIDELQLQAPRVDLAQVPAALDAVSPSPAAAGVPRWPTIAAGVSITHGQLLRGEEVLLRDVQLETGSLVPGQRFSLLASASSLGGMPLSLRFSALPQQGDRGISLQSIQLQIAAGKAEAELAGRLAWPGGDRIEGRLQGSLARDDQTYRLELQAEPGSAADEGTGVRMALNGEGAHLTMRLQPAQAAQWWSGIASGGPLALPPVNAQAEVATLDLGSLHLEGLRIDSDGQPAATSAARTPVPAAAASASPR
ncbi:MAG TPA: hypothetical protein VFG73_01260 [Rhodanobacteraceae bacterium]|nr:hypothetical protein [Rhodanobacteraceae bacterium]